MHYKILQKEDIAEAFIPLTEIQDNCRVYDPHEEELLMMYRDAAIDWAERYMNRAIGVKTVATEVTRPSACLPLGDVHEIISVEDENGQPVEYTFNKIANTINVKQKAIVTYSVGFKTVDIPKAIRLGIHRLITLFFENREDIIVGVSATEIPFNHRTVFDLYRIPAGG